MDEKLGDVISDIAERLTGKPADPETVTRLSVDTSSNEQVGLTDWQKKQLGDIATRFERPE